MSGDDVRAHLAALRLIALSLERFLALSHDARELGGVNRPGLRQARQVGPLRSRG